MLVIIEWLTTPFPCSGGKSGSKCQSSVYNHLGSQVRTIYILGVLRVMLLYFYLVGLNCNVLETEEHNIDYVESIRAAQFP